MSELHHSCNHRNHKEPFDMNVVISQQHGFASVDSESITLLTYVLMELNTYSMCVFFSIMVNFRMFSNWGSGKLPLCS